MKRRKNSNLMKYVYALIEENLSESNKFRLDVFTMNPEHVKQLDHSLNHLDESNGLRISKIPTKIKTSKAGYEFGIEIPNFGYEVTFLGNVALGIAIGIISNILYNYMKNDKGGEVYINNTIINIDKAEIHQTIRKNGKRRI